MPKKITIQTGLDKFEDDWGGKYHSGEQQPFPTEVTLKDNQEWGHTREAIEHAIKQKVLSVETGKYGAALAITDPSTLIVKIRYFANEDDMEKWQADSETYKDLVLGETEFQGAKAPEGYTLAVNVTRNLALSQVAGGDNFFTFTYNSYWAGDTSDLDPEPGTVTLKVNGGVMEELPIASGGNSYSINAGKYCTEDSNTVEIIVSNAHGSSRTWQFLVEAKTLGISLDASYLNQQHIAKTYNWGLPVFVSGVGGTVYVKVDNGNPTASYVGGNTSSTFLIDTNNTLSAGAHTLEIWCFNSTYGLETEHIFTQFIKAGSSVVLALGMNPANEMTIYSTVSIPYYFYHPDKSEGEEVEVTINLYDGSNVPVSSTTQNIVVDGNHSSGMQEAKVQLMDNYYIGQTTHLIISVGSVSLQHNIKVNAAGVTLQEASECKVHYDLGGKANADSDVASNSMESYYNNQRTSRLTRSSNFRLNTENGFHDGGCIIPANSTLTLLDWKPFATDFGANGTQTGKTIEMELSVGVCVNQDIPVVSCMDSKCGFEVFPNRVEVKHSSSDKFITYFPDGERVKFSLVINGTTTHCVNDDGNGHVEVTDRNLGFIYMNGVMVRIFEYGTATWNQITSQNVVFGSTEGRVMLHSFRGYDKALSMREILDNFAYDTPELQDKLAIATRNDILQGDGKTVDRNKIEAALPNTPIITWWAEQLPTNKKDPQTCTETEFVNPEWVEARGHACAPFTAGEHEINGDGTSSNAYPLPYKNWAEKFSGMTLHLIPGDPSGDLEVAKYSITYGINDKEKKFVHKVNYASSEGIFNILAMNMYQQLTLATKDQISDLLSKQQFEQDSLGDDITFRKSLSGFPEIGFRKHTVSGQVVTEFLSIYNFINNKKTGSMFGMEDNYKKNQLWEVDENRNFFLTPMTENTVVEGELVPSNGVRDDEPLYYARFPDESPVTGNDLGICSNTSEVNQANDEIKALRNIHNWIYSINPNVAKRYKARYGNYRAFTIAEDGFTSKTYAGITFTRDTEQYRAQKFLDEYQDHLHINDCIFYFLFCTWILGKDSMDKNMSLFLDDVEDFYSDFPEISSQAKVKLRIMLRDTDNANMFDNTGKLIFKYWHEWNDTYNSTTDETGEILGETWNGSSYSIISSINGGEPVFNGRLSGLWDAISQFIPDQVRNVYHKMRAAGLNFNSMLNMYQNFRNYWCEALYNVDGLGYVNTGNLDMAYGDKFLLSKYFYKYRERYMDSKYGVTDDSKQVTMRLYEKPVGVWMKHFTPMYASYNFGVGNPSVTRSINVGTAALIPCNSDSFSDATCYVNDADMVTEIGFYTMDGNTPILHGLEGLKEFCFTLNFERFTRLTKFIWNNTQARPNNIQTMERSRLNFSGMKMLRELVMTYCVNWEGAPVIGSDLIEKIDFRGTPISRITIPETETLTTLHLPSTLTALSLKNLPNLANFSIQGVANLESVEIENTPLVAEAIVNAIIQLIDGGGTPILSRGHLVFTSLSVTNYFKLKDIYGDEVFVKNDVLYFEVPNNVYLSYNTTLDAGEVVYPVVAVVSASAASTIVYELLEDGVPVTPEEIEGELIATSTNGSKLNVETGKLTTIDSTGDVLNIRAYVTIGTETLYSDIVNIYSIVRTYPNVAIGGRDIIQKIGTYTFNRVLDTNSYSAGLKSVTWSLTAPAGTVVLSSYTDTEAEIEVLGITSTLVQATLTITMEFKARTITVTKTIDIQIVEHAVDLELPSGVMWADGNLTKDEQGNYSIASNPEVYGCYVSFANIDGHNHGETYNFNQTTYNETPGSQVTGNIVSGDPEHDIVAARIGNFWRIPTSTETAELLNENNTSVAVESVNGISGVRITSKRNNNSIFLPFGGQWDNNGYINQGQYGNYRVNIHSRVMQFMYRNGTFSKTYSSYGVNFAGICIRPIR